MTAQKGSAFLLKIADGAAPPVYQTVAGLRTTQMSINGDTVVVTICESRGAARACEGGCVASAMRHSAEYDGRWIRRCRRASTAWPASTGVAGAQIRGLMSSRSISVARGSAEDRMAIDASAVPTV